MGPLIIITYCRECGEVFGVYQRQFLDKTHQGVNKSRRRIHTPHKGDYFVHVKTVTRYITHVVNQVVSPSYILNNKLQKTGVRTKLFFMRLKLAFSIVSSSSCFMCTWKIIPSRSKLFFLKGQQPRVLICNSG